MDITHKNQGGDKILLTFPVLNGTRLMPYTTSMNIDYNVTSNCQLFVVGCAYAMIGYAKAETKELLNYIGTKITTKRMMLVDINKGYLKAFKDQFSPFMEYMKVSHYRSSNGSQMCIVISQIDRNKLK